MSSVNLSHVDKAYGKHQILQDFSMAIPDGEFVSIIGSSGCGKTTVMKLINGLLTPDQGKVFIDEQDIAALDQTQLRRKIGYVIQNIGLFPHMSIAENITYVLSLQKGDDRYKNDQCAKLMEMMHLEPSLAKRYPDELSGGQKQRVGIARALAAKPALLLMDEPFGAVDEITRRSLQDELLAVQKQLHLTVVFVTHDIREALRLSDRMMVMKDGHIEQYAAVDSVRLQPATAFVEKLLSYAYL